MNFLTLRSMATFGFQQRFTAEAPLVSILVPARNEASNIARCVRSLLNQDYPNFELIVLDDNSEDATGSIVKMLSLPTDDPHKRLRLIKGEALPDGWLGKNFACYQLAEAANGEFLLFTDADTSHNANSLSSAMAAIYRQDVQFLSLFPMQQTISMSERMVVPLVQLFVYGLLPTWLVTSSPSPSISAANGQFMLFNRAVYDYIGGHAAVQGVVLEDVMLARLVKQAGFKSFLPDGRDTVTCRMYRNNYDVWRGFSKNLFAFFNYKLFWLTLFVMANLLVAIGPYLWLLLGWITHQPADPTWLWLPVAQILLVWFLRLLIAFRYSFNVLDVFLHPVSAIWLAAIGINSYRWSRATTEWKGRKYHLNS